MYGEVAIDPNAGQRLAAELQPGEKLVWSAQPNPAAYARGSWAVAIFGLAFGGFAVFWMIMAGAGAWFASGGPNSTGPAGPLGVGMSLFSLCGLPFLAVGIVMFTTPIWKRARAAKVIYAITDRRAIICGPELFRGTVIRSYAPAQLGKVSRAERSDGAGDLVFEEIVSYSSDSNGTSRHVTRRGFLGVERVAEVERLLRTTLLDPARPA